MGSLGPQSVIKGIQAVAGSSMPNMSRVSTRRIQKNMHKATDFCAPHEILFVMASCSLMPISPARSPTTRAKVEALVASVMLSRQRRTLMIPTIQSCGEVLNTS